VAANDPVLALSDFKPNFYNLLLVDIDMPRINGFELFGKIHRDLRGHSPFLKKSSNIFGTALVFPDVIKIPEIANGIIMLAVIINLREVSRVVVMADGGSPIIEPTVSKIRTPAITT
jgi:CheY-like chemotaxis protein